MSLRRFAVLLAGGVGTRLSPWSTPERPKQVLPLLPDGRSPLEDAFRRLSRRFPSDRVVVVTGQSMVDAVRQALPALPHDAFLVEPAGRNTLPALTWATAEVARRGGEALVSVHADHWIGDAKAFDAAIGAALGATRSGLTLVGLRPEHPATELGWMVTGPGPEASVRRVHRFVEKPAAPLARELMDAGALWNMGTFAWRVEHFEQALARAHPQMVAQYRRLVSGADIGEVWDQLPRLSVDHGLLETTSELFAVEGHFGWSDLGTWERVRALHGGRLPEGAPRQGALATPPGR